MSSILPHPQFGETLTLGEVTEWLLKDKTVAGEVAFILLAALGRDVASLPSPAALDAMSQSIAASLEKRRLGKHVIDGEGRVAFDEAARWVEVQRALAGSSSD